jgi:hypothetical protein
MLFDLVFLHYNHLTIAEVYSSPNVTSKHKIKNLRLAVARLKTKPNHVIVELESTK